MAMLTPCVTTVLFAAVMAAPPAPPKPQRILRADPVVAPTVPPVVAPPKPSNEPALSVDELVRIGATRIEAMQAKGPGGDVVAEWPYEGVYRVANDIPYGYRVGGTSIAGLALLAAPGLATDAARSAALVRAVEFVVQSPDEPLLSFDPSIYRGGYDVRNWGHCYGLRFLLQAKAALKFSPELTAKVDHATQFFLEALKQTEIPTVGGWQYARSTGIENPCSMSPFMTAPCLQALLEARTAGMEISPELIERTILALELCRGASGYVAYNAEKPIRDQEQQIPGAMGRMCATEVALAKAGKQDNARLKFAIDVFFKHWDELEKRRKKQGTHVAPYGVAPYYFFYAHLYAAEAIALLPLDEQRPLAARYLEVLLKSRDADGTWNDRVFARSAAYSTAMSVLALVDLTPALAPSATPGTTPSTAPAPKE
ncbi:MAG: hypothetical protein EXS10_04220 [Phycisphaerales bacterium]|nr:hypothetical protein [Phycisphaerales bacterium]